MGHEVAQQDRLGVTLISSKRRDPMVENARHAREPAFRGEPRKTVEALESLYPRIFNLMFYIPTFQRPSASLFIGARAR